MSPATVNVTDEKFVVDPDLRSHSEERPDPQTTPGPKGEVVRARARRAASCGRGGVDRHPAHGNFHPPKHNDDDRCDGGREYVLLREIAHAKPVLAVAPRSSSITCDRGEKNVNVNGTTQEERWAWSDGGWRSTDRAHVTTHSHSDGMRTMGTLLASTCMRARACLTEMVTLEVVLDEADEPRRAATSA